ncbi:hypothetical protein [Ensifer aridi]|uniref:hypothetical protein n=1 Tax=Ensifer aridi TaxID=1708715 RepID=UPI001AECCCEC|nr:hypothetical protein [Ensifer aridi]
MTPTLLRQRCWPALNETEAGAAEIHATPLVHRGLSRNFRGGADNGFCIAAMTAAAKAVVEHNEFVCSCNAWLEAEGVLVGAEGLALTFELSAVSIGL